MIEEPVNLPPEPGISASPDTAEQTKKGFNPIIAISIAIIIALTLAGVSLLVFLRSDIRESTNISEQTSQTAESDLSESPDETSVLSEDDLSTVESDITGSATDVNSDEFGSSELTDASLGL